MSIYVFQQIFHRLFMNIQNVKQKTLVMTVVTKAQVAKRENCQLQTAVLFICLSVSLWLKTNNAQLFCSDDESLSLKELSFVCEAGRRYTCVPQLCIVLCSG